LGSGFTHGRGRFANSDNNSPAASQIILLLANPQAVFTPPQIAADGRSRVYGRQAGPDKQVHVAGKIAEPGQW
jgi:hypothetical protein